MPKFALFTDSACDMPLAFLQENDVRTLFMRYSIGGQEFIDTMTTENSKQFFDAMRAGEQPRTVQVAPPDYLPAWETAYQEGLPIVHITLSSGMSGTYNSGVMAREQFIEQHPDAKVFVVDSLCASQGQGLLVYVAVQMRDAEKEPEECVQWLEDNRQNLNAWFTVQDLVYLKRGGRVSAASAAIGTMLDIKPIINVDNHGHLIPRQKVKGRKRAIKTLAETALANRTDQTNDFPHFITHADCYDDAFSLAEQLRANGAADVQLNDMGPIIGTHTGPGLIVLFYFGKTRPVE